MTEHVHPSAPTRGSRLVVWIGIALLVANIVTVLVLWLHRRHKDANVRDERTKTVEKGPRLAVARVEMSTADRKVTLPAEARAYAQTTLLARVGGYVREVNVDRGQRVKEGDVLAVVEAPETEQALRTARAEADNAKLNADRARVLAPGVVAVQELDNAVRTERSARANLAGALANRGYTALRAPFDGAVTARYADPGALLQANTPMVDVATLDRLRVFVYVGQDAAPFVHPGDPVTIWQDELPDRRIPTSVTRTASSLDPRTRTMTTEMEIDNRPWGVLPGSFVHAELHLKVTPGPIIPNDALLVREGQSQVAVVDGDEVHFVRVGLGSSDGKTTRVTSGLQGGESIGINVPMEVTDGAHVQVQQPLGR
jgi:RND family efflux transporter MFP subunit